MQSGSQGIAPAVLLLVRKSLTCVKRLFGEEELGEDMLGDSHASDDQRDIAFRRVKRIDFEDRLDKLRIFGAEE